MKCKNSGRIRGEPLRRIQVQKPQMINITTKPFEVGLISDRHNIPVGQYIFDIFTQEMMFDYDEQYRIAQKFLDEYIGFNENGIPNRDLIVYLTGLQIALATVVKVCYDNKVNLTLKHYNNQTRVYHDQVIFDDFDNKASISPFYILLNSYKYIYTYGIKESDVRGCKSLHLIEKTMYYKEQEPVKIAYICPDFKTAQIYYGKIIRGIDHRSPITDLIIHSIYQEKHGYLSVVNTSLASYRDVRKEGGD